MDSCIDIIQGIWEWGDWAYLVILSWVISDVAVMVSYMLFELVWNRYFWTLPIVCKSYKYIVYHMIIMYSMYIYLDIC